MLTVFSDWGLSEEGLEEAALLPLSCVFMNHFLISLYNSKKEKRKLGNEFESMKEDR